MCMKCRFFVCAVLAPLWIASAVQEGATTWPRSFVRKEAPARAHDSIHAGVASNELAYTHLLDHLAQCACLPDDATTPPLLNTDLSKQATEARGRRYPPTKQFLEAIHDLQLTIFLRGGTLLSAIRNQGWMPYDYDFDAGMAADTPEQATQFVQKLKDYLQGKDPQFTVDRGNSGLDFRVWHASVSEWPIADGAVFYRSADSEKKAEESWKLRKPSDECKDLLNMPSKFLAAKFEDMEWAPFYDTSAPIPPNAREFLDKIYGEKWSCEADNKCSSPNGMLFKKDPDHCNMPLYVGAQEYPLHTCGLSMQRGPLAEDESPLNAVRAAVAAIVSKA